MARRLPDWIASYLRFTRHHEAAEQFHLWTALSVLAAAVNRNCWMDGGYYRTFPNIYVLFIGPSGVGKSSSSGIGIDMLKSIPNLHVHIFKDFITPAGLIEFMQQSLVSVDINGKIVHKTPVMVYASELGTLLNSRSGIRELTLLLTELFNKQGDHEDTTRGKGKVIIRRPNLTFHGCTFPEWLDEELSAISLRSGFFGRMFIVSSHQKRKLAPNISLDSKDLALQKDLMHDLELIGSLYGTMRWDDETQEAWDEWYAKLPKDFSEEADEAVEVKGFTARKGQFVQRLAMLSALSKRNNLIITMDDFDFALKQVDLREKESRKLSPRPSHVVLSEKIFAVLDRMRKRSGVNEFTIRDVAMRSHRFADSGTLEEILRHLCNIGAIEIKGKKVKIVDIITPSKK